MLTARLFVPSLALSALALAPAVAEATPPVHSPWPCGVDESVSQGHLTTSSHAAGTRDAWAWDLRRGVGDPVVAPFDGIVRAAKEDSTTSCGIGGGCWLETNHIVLVHDDGTESLFMHLAKDTVPFEVGDVVRRGEVVGQVGLTGQITGAHLHFGVQDASDCSVNGPWWCTSLETRFVDTGDPLASNAGSPVDYTSRNCVLESECIVGPDDVLTMDDTSGCFIDAEGDAAWERYDEPSDSYSYRYLRNVSGSEGTGEGYWRFRVEESGLYRVEVQMPWWNELVPNGSVSVSYEVGSGGESTVVGPVDQLGNSASWVVLGEDFLLREETESYVRLGNATPEADGATLVGFDQVRVTRVGDYQPPRCAVVGGTEIDDASECFSTEGDNWFEEPGGRDGFMYSNSNALASPLEVGTWELEVASTEPHQIWIYAPDEAETQRASYQLYNGYITLDLDPVDQSQGGWIKLTHEGDDQLELYAGRPARLSLGDDTGEPFVEGADNTIVAYDAIAIAPASLGFDPNTLEEKQDGFGDGGASRGESESGCACRVRSDAGPGGALLLGLGLWGLRRRRLA